MLIVARLAPALQTRLRIAAGAEYRLLEADSWVAFRHLVRSSPAQVAVADPCADGQDESRTAPAIAAIGAAAAVTTVFVYATITPAATRAMLALSASGIRHFVLSGVDDEPSRFREQLEMFRAPGLEEEVLAPVLAALGEVRAPPSVREALRALFRAPRRYETAEQLADAAGVSRQYLNRCLADAGLVPARVMVAAARVLRAYQYARVPGLTIADVAARLRYADTRTLVRHVREVVGATLPAWSATTPAAACVAQITARLGLGTRRPLYLVGGSERRVGRAIGGR